jgi:hypothetical protein
MSTQLSRTFGSQGNQRTFTISVWVKRTRLGTQTQSIFGSGGSGAYATHMYFRSDDKLDFWNYFNSAYAGRKITSRVFRDTSSWYHIVFRVDTTSATGSERMRIYVNGEEETDFDTNDLPGQNQTMEVGHTGAHYIGGYGTGANFEGMMSHFHYCDGQSYAPTEFGETDSTTGEWKIKTEPSVSYGTSGHFLFKNDASVNDQSGLGNNWSVSGTLTKSEDNPSNVFATWNPLWAQSNGNVGDVVFSQGNLTTTTSVNYRTSPASLGMLSGKYYWEIKREEDTGQDLHVGIMSENATPANTATWIGNAANGWVMAGDGGEIYTGGTNDGVISNGSFPNAGDIAMIAYDADNGNLYFGANGTWAGSADPSAGTGAQYTGLDTSLFYFPCVSTGSDCSANFGNGYFGTTAVSSAGTNASGIGIFEYNVPTGFTALSTKGINSF